MYGRCSKIMKTEPGEQLSVFENTFGLSSVGLSMLVRWGSLQGRGPSTAHQKSSSATKIHVCETFARKYPSTPPTTNQRLRRKVPVHTPTPRNACVHVQGAHECASTQLTYRFGLRLVDFAHRDHLLCLPTFFSSFKE